ncbi:hypothetical protein [Nitratidesulfovibrio sp. SRB-5]|uniref:hypothetical protein n=1 Tax=Nitratidesulfovibrio sp. SRB-5 TaxID=2872636 RepID=UPI0010267235|nr:hypothetical protein [Nitratidesulfovibrio sp. SRB-5]MBZ2172724.1 pyrimidine/purine nucleoside phosphorylase [Nitratidesulfovibrio sp. SRB-5]RXF77286.1 hypothetical protein EKK70_07590 [Desulfovibrio sp. DS-1]
MPIRHAVLAALLFTLIVLPALSAFATGGGKRYEQVGEHYDVSINYPVLHHPATDADIVRIVWKLTDAFRRMAGHGLPRQSAAAPNPRQDDGTAGADRPGSTDTSGPTGRAGSTGASNPPHAVMSHGAVQGTPRADADVYAPARRDWLTATHRISRPSANAVSVVFEVQTGLWGRDGVTVSLDLLAVSYDLAAGRRIELDDLFGDDDCAGAVLVTHLRHGNGGGPSAAPSAVGGAPGPVDKGGSGTSQGNAETPVTFWLTPRGLMVLPGSCCWQTVSAGGSSSVPGNFAVDARRTPAAPSSAVEVPIEPLLQCAPHLSYWGRGR